MAKTDVEEVQVLDAVTSEERSLEYTQGVRKRIVDELTEKGIPQDKGILIAVLHTLDGMDRQTLGKMRIKTDDKAATSQAAAAGMVAQILTQMNPKQLERHDPTRLAPTLGKEFEDVELIEGETAGGTQGGDYEGFTKKYPDGIALNAKGEPVEEPTDGEFD